MHQLPDAETGTKAERITGDREVLTRALAEFQPDLIHLRNNWEPGFTRLC